MRSDAALEYNKVRAFRIEPAGKAGFAAADGRRYELRVRGAV